MQLTLASVYEFSGRLASPTAPLVRLLLAVGLAGMSTGTLASDWIAFQAPPPQGGAWNVKVENGFAVLYKGSTQDTTKDQIYLLDRTGRPLRSLNPLSSAVGASSIAIWDVSVAATGWLAVNAVLKSTTGQLSAALLIYDGKGALQNSLALNRGEFNKIEFDEQGNVWGLGQAAGRDDPADVPMVFEYDHTGTLLNQFLRRSQFPRDAKGIREGLGHGGSAAFGLAPGMAWFWLPESKQFVTMKRDGSDVKIISTGLPAWTEGDKAEKDMEVEVETVQRLSSGQILFEVFFRGKSGHNKRSLFLWEAGAWKRIPFADVDSFSATLVGVSGDDLVLLRQRTPQWQMREAPLQ